MTDAEFYDHVFGKMKEELAREDLKLVEAIALMFHVAGLEAGQDMAKVAERAKLASDLAEKVCDLSGVEPSQLTTAIGNGFQKFTPPEFLKAWGMS